MKKIVPIIIFLMLGFLAGGVQDTFAEGPPKEESKIECPPNHRCIPSEIAAEWKEALENHQCMLTALDSGGESPALFRLDFEDSYKILVTQEGQIFDQEEWIATLTWCAYEIDLHMKPDLRVHIKEDYKDAEPVWGFRLRLRLALNIRTHFMIKNRRSDPLTWVEPALAFEPFFFRDLHIASYIGSQTFGLIMGYDLTRNLDVYVGYGVRWRPSSNTEESLGGPVLGLSLSFN